MFKKKLTIQEKTLFAVTVGVGVAAYVYHRKQINAVITVWQGARDETVWSSFDSGVQYGILLAQRLAAGEVVSTDDVKTAAFSVLDKTA